MTRIPLPYKDHDSLSNLLTNSAGNDILENTQCETTPNMGYSKMDEITRPSSIVAKEWSKSLFLVHAIPWDEDPLRYKDTPYSKGSIRYKRLLKSETLIVLWWQAFDRRTLLRSRGDILYQLQERGGGCIHCSIDCIPHSSNSIRILQYSMVHDRTRGTC